MFCLTSKLTFANLISRVRVSVRLVSQSVQAAQNNS